MMIVLFAMMPHRGAANLLFHRNQCEPVRGSSSGKSSNMECEAAVSGRSH